MALDVVVEDLLELRHNRVAAQSGRKLAVNVDRRDRILKDADIGAVVAEYARRWALSATAADRLERLVRLVSSDASAPTTVQEPTRVLEDHLADSLVALELRDIVWQEAEIADLGAGAGFPGLPLAIALPGSRLWLVESNERKCQFLRHAVAECGLDNVEVVRERVELWRAGVDRCDLAVARALAPLAVVAEYAAPLLHVGGSLVAWRGRRDPVDEAAGDAPRSNSVWSHGRHWRSGRTRQPSTAICMCWSRSLRPRRSSRGARASPASTRLGAEDSGAPVRRMDARDPVRPGDSGT